MIFSWVRPKATGLLGRRSPKGVSAGHPCCSKKVGNLPARLHRILVLVRTCLLMRRHYILFMDMISASTEV